MSKTNQTSLLALANVEALAGGEASFDFYCAHVNSDICDIEFFFSDGTFMEFPGVRVENPNL